MCVVGGEQVVSRWCWTWREASSGPVRRVRSRVRSRPIASDRGQPFPPIASRAVYKSQSTTPWSRPFGFSATSAPPPQRPAAATSCNRNIPQAAVNPPPPRLTFSSECSLVSSSTYCFFRCRESCADLRFAARFSCFLCSCRLRVSSRAISAGRAPAEMPPGPWCGPVLDVCVPMCPAVMPPPPKAGVCA